MLATTSAVVAGITYNFLPFMILPIYASLEQIDKRVLEAAQDLYGRRRDVVARVVVPMAMPGIVAGVLLTFIPAAGDFINAELLGTPQQFMIGNVIQSRFLEVTDYPTAAALSFVLMAIILVMVAAYARMVGTEALTGAEEGPRDDVRPASCCTLARRLRRGRVRLPAGAIAIILLFSFNDPTGRFNYQWQGFTLDNWANPFEVTELTDAFLTSLEVAVIATIVSTILGTLMALALVRYEFRGRAPVNFFIFLPLATPEVVLGAALLSLFISFSAALAS